MINNQYALDKKTNYVILQSKKAFSMDRIKMMDKSNKINKTQNRKISMTSGNLIAVYTVLRVLLKMRNTLGLEAMLDYIRVYTGIIESNNREFKDAVTGALKFINVKKIYDDAIK